MARIHIGWIMWPLAAGENPLSSPRKELLRVDDTRSLGSLGLATSPCQGQELVVEQFDTQLLLSHPLQVVRSDCPHLAKRLLETQDLGAHQIGIRNGVVQAIVFHLLQGARVCPDEHEGRGVDLDFFPDDEILGAEPLPCLRVSLPALRGELPLGMARVPLRQLPDAYAVIGQVYGDDEPPIHVLRPAIHHLSGEAKHLVRVQHQLVDVPVRGPRRQVQATGQRILFGAEARVRRVGERDMDRIGVLDLDRALLDTHVLHVEIPCEVVAVVEHDVPAIHAHRLADDEVLWLADVRFRLQHPGSRGLVRVLLQGAPPPEDRVRVAARVPGKVFEHLHRVIGQVVVQDVIHATAVRGRVVPIALERQDLPIVLQVLLQLEVLPVPAQDELVVFLALVDLFLSARLQHGGLLDFGGAEGVHRGLLPALHFNTQRVHVELSREVVAADDPEGSTVDVDGRAHAQVLVCIVATNALARRFGDPVALHEGALGYPSVLNLRLTHHDGAVLQVEVNDAMPHTEVLCGILVNRLLEVGEEAEHLSVVLQPSRGDVRPIGVPGRIPHGLALVVCEGPCRGIEAMHGILHNLERGEVQFRHLSIGTVGHAPGCHLVHGTARPVVQGLRLPLMHLRLMDRIARQEGN
mmetsp:Transcript_119207/g.254345  ORF Transcript_119207/g.254345 Transcript_119207/m.254345 type:complete len:636 (-) Transcript_119207:155-2062(-)